MNRDPRGPRSGGAPTDRGRSNAILSRISTSQREANRSALGHESSMVGHRARLTEAILACAPAGNDGRLCLLGAGNANDVDPEALAGRFREIHFVDLDVEALERVRQRLAPNGGTRFQFHGPLDLSGMFEELDRWSQLVAGPGVAEAIKEAAQSRAAALPGVFDTVVSCCMLTQMQLSLLELIGDRHPAFVGLRAALNAIHVRTLTALVAPGGKALLATDMTSSATYPFDSLPPDPDLGKLFEELLHAGNLIYVAHPGLLSAEIRRDPDLNSRFKVRFPIGPWLWQNGPDLTYLVYGLEITRER